MVATLYVALVFSCLSLHCRCTALTLRTGYWGAGYAATLNRIYFTSYHQTGADWHYVDCNTGNVGTFAATGASGVSDGNYFGLIFAPTQDRLYLVPRLRANDGNNWEYIDGTDGVMHSYDVSGFSKPTDRGELRAVMW